MASICLERLKDHWLLYESDSSAQVGVSQVPCAHSRVLQGLGTWDTEHLAFQFMSARTRLGIYNLEEWPREIAEGLPRGDCAN